MEQKILDFIRAKVREKLGGDSTGHDYYHVERVSKMGVQLALLEGADELVCCAAGYLHDYYRPDEKERGVSHSGEEALADIRSVLNASGMDTARIDKIIACIAEHEYYPHTGHAIPATLESRILQDADRLDAMGAIGIARTFTYHGAHGGSMYLPGDKNTDTPIRHFYDKLLLLATQMHTKAAFELAKGYHLILENFLEDFFNQWESKLPDPNKKKEE